MVSKTGSSSPGELDDDAQDFGSRRLLLQRLGKFAVRCCNSLSSRTFSIAMTAWSAKSVDKLDLLVGKRLHLFRVDDATRPRRAIAEHRHSQQGAEVPESNRQARIFGIGLHIVDLNDLPSRRARRSDAAVRFNAAALRISSLRSSGDAYHTRPFDKTRRLAPRDHPQIGFTHALPRLAAAYPTPPCRSKAERLMTLSTSAVAVCCSQ